MYILHRVSSYHRRIRKNGLMDQRLLKDYSKHSHTHFDSAAPKYHPYNYPER
jgi:hypothetical protein